MDFELYLKSSMLFVVIQIMGSEKKYSILTKRFGLFVRLYV